MAWHRFVVASDDDHECSNPRCGIVASDDVIDCVQLPCPAPSCREPANLGACVFVATEDVPVCSYCCRRANADVDEDVDIRSGDDQSPE